MPGNLIRRRARRQVEAERACLRKAGIPSVLIEPGPDVVDVMGMDFMSGTNLRDIVAAAFLDTGDQLRAPITRTLLAGLNHRTRAPSPRSARRSRRAPRRSRPPARSQT
jgi:hypothetical protein